jgi:hypothetical protein
MSFHDEYHVTAPVVLDSTSKLSNEPSANSDGTDCLPHQPRSALRSGGAVAKGPTSEGVGSTASLPMRAKVRTLNPRAPTTDRDKTTPVR